MTDDLETKLARLAARVENRTGDIRKELAAIGCLELADELKARFGARLAYIKTPRLERGNDDLMRPGCVWTEYIRPKVKRGETP